MIQVDFLKIINIHVALKNYLTDLLAGIDVAPLEHAKIKQDNGCYLGKLIFGDEQLLANYPAFEEVRSLHANFHGVSAEVLRLYQAGQHEKATQLLHGRFDVVFRRLKSRIILLSHQYHADLINANKTYSSPNAVKESHTPHLGVVR
ncbi:MAG: CZB domain-containing protein [Methylotenera sp.]|nr:CZB domain-containing protein [Methylotenera sp.]